MKNKCQKCAERAVIHITELDEDSTYREVHLCFEHAQEYLRESEQVQTSVVPPSPQEEMLAAAEQITSKAQCPICRISFEEFRSSGRLGCAHDYEVFREELRPLLENIHGGLRHLGKVPRRLPKDTRLQNQLLQLRQELQQAVAVEDYETAARLRDQIAALESQR